MTSSTFPRRLHRLVLPAMIAMAAASGSPAFSQGFGNSFGGLQVNGGQPISIDAAQLDVDDAKATATFTGDVSVAQGDTLLKTSTLVVHYIKPSGEDGKKPGPAGAMPGGSNDIDRLEATGKVYVKSQDQVATADKATFDMKSQLVVMTGDVVLTQGPNVATGCRLTIHMDTNLARLDSDSCAGRSTPSKPPRVKMVLTPQQNGAQ
ncbi:LptA/OstA family protein [Mangrovibrevibacter kandeliae]|uniref:LptA/OstA family protein n=1 Tax=Mangrovibrevibacter kandeliae TaxID=2968473 RepID=UPI002119719D|nr:LptA/OstA family protein [Aurantimonas sp. CSK15Z-1]MCQ8782200.1 OstA family protein [Aurantimonas sp. CSK15Z-1]